MKRNLILLVALLLCGNFLHAQNLNAYFTESVGLTRFSWPCTGPFTSSCENKERQIQTEYPPYIIGGGWRTYFFTNGSGSSVASHPNSMVTSGQLNFKDNGSPPSLISSPSGCGSNEPWRLEYYSAYSAQYVNHPTAGTVSVAFVEGENYELPGTGNPTSGCGYQNGDVNRTFLCLAWTPNTEATNWAHQYFTDMGPIIWPATGYFLSNGQGAGSGCANNTTIQANGYLYVFYKDQSDYNIGQAMGAGRLPGIKVARAPIGDALNPLAYQTFYEDGNGIHWNQSLPAGFNKSNITSFYSSPGPQGSTLLESSRDYTRFAVAKVNGTNYYMGLGNYPDPDPSKRWKDAQGNWYSPQITTLKYSYDLLHWFGDRQVYIAPNYKLSQFNYPIFLNANGWTNTDIDENNFYIAGTRPEYAGVKNEVYTMRIYIPPPEHSGGPIGCDWYLHVNADASGITIGDVDVTGDKLTVEAVFNRTEDFGYSTAGGDLVSKHCSTTDANYFLRPESAGITTTDGYFQVDLPCYFERWMTNHVAMVYDGSYLSLYRNGHLEASVPATGNLITNDYETTIGTEACSSNWGDPIHFQGYIGEVRIWKEARTQQQIQQFRNVIIGEPIVNTNLLAYYTFFGYANRGSFPGSVNNIFGDVSTYQTNPNCTIETYGCYSARKDVSTTKGTVNGKVAASVSNTTVPSAATPVVIYPNPARGAATLLYSSNSAGAITIEVIDVTGKRAMVMKKTVMNGSNTINIPLNGLSNGVYSVQLFDGNKMLTKKLVVSK